MVKDITLQKTVWRKFTTDGIELHEINNVEEYRKSKVQVYVQDGKRKDTPTYYVAIEDYTPARRANSSLKAKLANAIANTDLKSMSATELLALLS